MISDKTIPPLQTDEPFNQADTKTDKTHDNEHENQRIIGDGTDKGANPSNRASNKRTNVIDDSRERTSGRSRRR